MWDDCNIYWDDMISHYDIDMEVDMLREELMEREEAERTNELRSNN